MMTNKKGLLAVVFTVFICLTAFMTLSAQETNTSSRHVLKVNAGQMALWTTLMDIEMAKEDLTRQFLVFFLPLEYQYCVTSFLSLNAEICLLFSHFVPLGFVANIGVSVFPFGKGPDGPYLSVMGGISVDPSRVGPSFKATTGYQFVMNNRMIIDLGIGITYIKTYDKYNNKYYEYFLPALDISVGFSF